MLTGQLVLFQGINRFNNHPGLFGISHLFLRTGPRLNRDDLYFFLADRTGLEPATSAVTGRHSNQLNYRSVPSKWVVSTSFFGMAKIARSGFAAKSFSFKYPMKYLIKPLILTISPN